MNIKYLAQNDIQLSKKKKVYFACHPDDFNSYSKALSNDLFKHCDCAVYYYDPKDEIDPSVKNFDLSHMRLFVFAVTKKFLTTPNSAYDDDLKFALEKNIPVLPILVEPEIETMAREKFVSLQFLNKSDINEDKYKEKLESYIKNIFGKDKLEKRIEDAFYGKAFISYRKKDRRDAISVMRTLHRRSINSFLGMWYDEFLIPGEDFNENIADGIRECDLFVMVITPNIAEDGNYVLNNEYPLAKQLNKFIIPVVTEAVDIKLLRKQYPALPPCISIRDHKRLSEAVKTGLSHLPKKERGLSDFYYMGIAYTEGIGVEKNVKEGIALLDYASGKGYILAMEKLMKMYRWGDGVEIDYKEALKWQKLIVKTREKFVSRKNTMDNREDYYNALYSLSYLYQKNEMYNEAEQAVQTGITYAENILSQDKYKESYKDFKFKYTLLTHRMILLADQQKFKESRDVYESFIGELEEKERENLKFNSQLVATYNSMQGIYQREGNLKGVHEMAEKSLKATERSAKDSYGRTNIPRALLHSRQGRAYLEEENYIAAEKECKTAVEMYESFKKLDDPRDIHNISNLTADLATVYKNWGKYKNAIPLYLKAIEYRELYMEKPENMESLCYFTYALAQCYYKTGKYDIADKYFSITDEHFKKLCKLLPDDYKIESLGWYRKDFPVVKSQNTGGENVAQKNDVADIIFKIATVILTIICLICQGIIYLIKKGLSLFIK